LTAAVFVDTENLCRGRGLRFVAVDLRQTLELVFTEARVDAKEVERVSVFGPWHVNDHRFTRIRDTIDPAIANFVTTEIIAGKSVLDTKLALLTDPWVRADWVT